MNIFSILGLLIAVGVVGIGLRLATDSPVIFLDYPSLFIVIGGSLASAAVSFQLNKIFVVFKIFFKRILGYTTVDYKSIIVEIIKIVESYRNGISLEKQVEETKDYFLKDAMKMLSEGMLDEDRSLKLMRKRADNLLDQHTKEAQKIKVLSKYPPAFGMMGTTIGMVVLLSNLSNKDAIKMVGPSMAICLITTLYGLILTNVVLIPVAENLMAASREVHLKNMIIVEGMRLLLKKDNPVAVAEELNTYLPPHERVDWRKVLKGG